MNRNNLFIDSNFNMGNEIVDFIKPPFPPNITARDFLPKNNNKPKRPPNCFIAYRAACYRENTKLSGIALVKFYKICSKSWSMEPKYVKDFYAELCKEVHLLYKDTFGIGYLKRLRSYKRKKLRVFCGAKSDIVAVSVVKPSHIWFTNISFHEKIRILREIKDQFLSNDPLTLCGIISSLKKAYREILCKRTYVGDIDIDKEIEVLSCSGGNTPDNNADNKLHGYSATEFCALERADDKNAHRILTTKEISVRNYYLTYLRNERLIEKNVRVGNFRQYKTGYGILRYFVSKYENSTKNLNPHYSYNKVKMGLRSRVSNIHLIYFFYSIKIISNQHLFDHRTISIMQIILLRC